MKKIISLIILSILLSSCSIWTKNNLEKKEAETNKTVNQETNIWTNQESNTWDIVETETTETEIKEEETNSWDIEKTQTTKITETDNSPKNINNNEEALEAEVNMLLDEFIDSLDNYDKQ